MSPLTNNLIVLPVLVPMVAAIGTMLLRGSLAARRALGVLALGSTTAVGVWLLATLPDGSGAHVSLLGSWGAPYGIAVVYDGVSGLLITVGSIVALACFLHAVSTIGARLEGGWFHPLFHLLVMGVNYSFLTGDLFNLFVAFEIMLMASYALLCLGASREQISQAYKYVVLNLIASTIFVLGAGLLYGMLGTLNYADLARIVAESGAGGDPLPAGFGAVAVMLLFVFGLKAAMFPLWFWLPDTYHTMPASVGALFAALLSKVGVYAVLRLYPMIFAAPSLGAESVAGLLLPLAACLTMLLAILGAVGATSVRRLLSFVLMSHVGYLVFGVSVMTPEAHAGVLYYMAQEMLVMAGLFLCAGIIERHTGTDDLRSFSGLQGRAKWLGVAMLVLLLSLAGLPPFAGFFGKALLVREGIAAGSWILVGATLLTATLTLLAALRVWCHGFWMPGRGEGVLPPPGASFGASPRVAGAFAGVWLLVGASVAFGLGSGLTVPLTMRAASGIVDPTAYIDAVLGPREGAVRTASVDADGEGVAVR